MGLLPKKSHQLIRDAQSIIGIVWDTQLDQKISEAHDAQSDLSGSHRPGLDRCQWETGSIKHIVKEANRQWNQVPELFIVDAARAPVCGQASGDIDRSERARFVGQQRLFATRVRGFDCSEVRRGIGSVDGIEEEHTRFA